VPAELASTVQALRALIDETRRSEAPDATLVRARELIDAASERWRTQGFPPVPGETEFIPLPDR